MLLVLLALVSACESPPGQSAVAESRLTAEAIAAEVAAAMDTSADPCRDFYRYACGGWLDTSEIPADRPRWTRSFSEINERNFEILRGILDDTAASPGDDPDRKRLGTFWASCTNEEAVEAAGAGPLAGWLEQADAIEDAGGLMKLAGNLQAHNVGVLMSMGVFPDFKSPDVSIAFFSQGGIGLPDRDFYFRDDEQGKALFEQYGEHVARMLVLLGAAEDEAADQAARIVGLETELARVSRPRQEMRKPEEIYNKLDIGGLAELTPRLDWGAFVEGMGYPKLTEINVTVPEFYEGLERLVHETDLDTIRAYVRWHLVHAMAPYLSSAFVEENFAFYGKTLSGQQELRPRWKRCLEAADSGLGDILGRLYVERHFAGESKQIAVDLIRSIETAFEANLAGLDWMDGVTRERALEKMHALTNKIGYPEKWRDYSGLGLKKGDFFANVLRAGHLEFQYQLDKVGGPVDPTEWRMTPPTVNAYYNPLQNEMVFPAGIMQPPFFHRDFPTALNLGGIGMVMGHELTHGFDDSGRKFDPQGRLTQWWEDEAVEKFGAQADCVAELYDGYEVQEGLNLNGRLTLGENIADLGGIKESWRAYREAIGDAGSEESIVAGVTNDQLFFVGFAQGWCSLISPEWERRAVIMDTHSHPRYRVLGPASQLRAFAETFQCDPGTPMHPEQVCEVW
jgi:predicted metalloendopeptidase